MNIYNSIDSMSIDSMNEYRYNEYTMSIDSFNNQTKSFAPS